MTMATIDASSGRTRRPDAKSTPADGRPSRPAELDAILLRAAYSEHHDAVYRLAYGILRDGPAAEDVVQDAFVKLWIGNAQFDPSRGAMRGLIMTIARHTSIDVIRARTRRLRTENLYCTDATYVTDGPEDATVRADEARQVRDAVHALPTEQRSTVEMAYFGGLTRREIAASSALPIGTVKSRMRLGMRKLRVTLRDQAQYASTSGAPATSV
jgi:RNA polymerase sigma-70 factor, ECF subfamily